MMPCLPSFLRRSYRNSVLLAARGNVFFPFRWLLWGSGKWDFFEMVSKAFRMETFQENSSFLMLHDHPSTLIKHRWISKNRNGFNMGQNLQWFLIIDIELGSRMTPKSMAKKSQVNKIPSRPHGRLGIF